MKVNDIEKKKVNLKRPGPPEITIDGLVLKRLDGLPFFYQALMTGTVGKDEIMVGFGLNGGSLYVMVGEAWYALPMKEFTKALVSRIKEEIK